MENYILVVELIRKSDGKKIYIDGFGTNSTSDKAAMAEMEQYLSKFAALAEMRRERERQDEKAKQWICPQCKTMHVIEVTRCDCGKKK